MKVVGSRSVLLQGQHVKHFGTPEWIDAFWPNLIQAESPVVGAPTVLLWCTVMLTRPQSTRL